MPKGPWRPMHALAMVAILPTLTPTLAALAAWTAHVLRLPAPQSRPMSLAALAVASMARRQACVADQWARGEAG